MKALLKYLQKRETAISSLLELPRHKYGSDSFHQLRVELKKLHALFSMVKGCSPGFKQKKTFKPFKQLFDQAGKLRDLQVEEALLREYSSPTSLLTYKAELGFLRKKAKAKYFAMLTKKFRSALYRKYEKLAPYLSAITEDQAEDYIEKRKQEITVLVQQEEHQPKHLHELRKKLKQLKYIGESLQGEQKQLTADPDVLADKLGKWHDCQVILGHLNKTNDLDLQETGQLLAVKEKLMLKSKALVTEIVADFSLNFLCLDSGKNI